MCQNPYAEADDGKILKSLRRQKKGLQPVENEVPATPEVTSELIDLAKIRDRVAGWVEDVKERCKCRASFVLQDCGAPNASATQWRGCRNQ